MQKRIITVAVAGLLSSGAFAQASNVTISGRMAAGFEQYNLSGVAGFGKENRVSDQSSRIILSVNENLGGGLATVGQVDLRFLVDTGGRQQLNAAPTFFDNGIASGNTFIGLKSDTLGRFVVGSHDLHYTTLIAIDSYRAGGLGNHLGLGMMSAVNNRPIANWTRTNNVMMWDSPNWGGLNAKVAYSTYGGSSVYGSNEGSGANDGSKGGSTNIALSYANGPIQAGFSHFKKDEEQARKTLSATGAAGTVNAPGGYDEKGTTLYGSYTFPMGLKVGLGWNKSSTQTYLTANNTADGWTDRTAWILPMSYTVGAHAFYLTYAKAGDRKGAAAASDSDAKGVSVGYDYGLSKRTSVGVYYTKLTNNTNAAYSLFQVSNSSGGYNGATGPAAGNDPSSLYFGLAHNF